MGKKWIPSYPDAYKQYCDYQWVVEELQNYITVISEASGIFLPTVTDLTDSQNILLGTYYEEFAEKTMGWCEELRKIKNDIDSFYHELRVRISNAEKQRDLWHSRIAMGYFEYESEEVWLQE